MRSLLFGLSLVSTTGALTVGLAATVLALPAVLRTQDVGSQVNVRSQPTVESTIVHQGITGDRLNTLADSPGGDGFVWYEVQFEENNVRGWVREDLLQLGTHEAPIRPGRYWVGPVGMGLDVQSTQYRYYDETGDGEWQPLTNLQYVTDGVVVLDGQYWCHAELPEPESRPGQASTIFHCSETGWTWFAF